MYLIVNNSLVWLDLIYVIKLLWPDSDMKLVQAYKHSMFILLYICNDIYFTKEVQLR